MKTTRNFADIIKAKKLADPDFARDIEREAFFAKVAQMVYDARTKAGLNQKQLAELVDTQQSVISRIEAADYEGHTLNTLWRIGNALGIKLNLSYDGDPVCPQGLAVIAPNSSTGLAFGARSGTSSNI